MNCPMDIAEIRCQWCGMGPETGKSYLNWKCGTRQNSKGTRTQSDACAEIVRLKDALRDIQQEAGLAQGEWSAVNVDYSPEWTWPLKAIAVKAEAVLEGKP